VPSWIAERRVNSQRRKDRQALDLFTVVIFTPGSHAELAADHSRSIPLAHSVFKESPTAEERRRPLSVRK
ncbi:MAG: hypothetical protein ACK50J_05295, partial [Planctomyces sp.]